MSSFTIGVIVLVLIFCLGLSLGFLGTRLTNWPLPSDIIDRDAWRAKTYIMFCKLAKCNGDIMDEKWPGLNCDSIWAVHGWSDDPPTASRADQ